MKSELGPRPTYEVLATTRADEIAAGGYQAQASGPGPPLPTGGKSSSSRCRVASSSDDVQGAEGRVELLDRARADDRRGDAGLGEQPGQGQVGRVGRRARRQSFSYASIAARCCSRPSAARPSLERPAEPAAAFAMRAAEQAAVQRRPGDDAQPVLPGGGQHLQLDRAGHAGCRCTARRPGRGSAAAPPTPAPARCASRRSCDEPT